MNKVYMYRCPNNKVYIGQTGDSLSKRAGNNGYNYKNCTMFWRAIKKYGWKNIKGKVLLDNLTDEEADYWEIKLIWFYKSLDMCYNISLGGKFGVKGYTHNTKDRQKLSKALTKKEWILQIDQNGRMVNEYETLSEASYSTGISKPQISAVLNKKLPHAHRFRFLYADSTEAQRIYGKELEPRLPMRKDVYIPECSNKNLIGENYGKS